MVLDTQAVRRMAEELTRGAEHLVNTVWPWLIKQQYLESLLAWGFFLLTAPVFGYVAWRSVRLWDTWPDRKRSVMGTISIVLGFLTVAAVTIVAVKGFGFLNPEYYALKDLTKLLHGGGL